MRDGYEPPVPFHAAEMAELRRHARLMGATFDLSDCARRINRSRADTNLMLDALIGRTPVEAAEVLNARPGMAPRDWGAASEGGKLARGLKAFLREVFDER